MFPPKSDIFLCVPRDSLGRRLRGGQEVSIQVSISREVDRKVILLRVDDVLEMEKTII